MMPASGVAGALALAAAPAPAGVAALGGGGGLVHFLIRLFIWHEIWRLVLTVWHIHTFGPVIVVVVVLLLAGLAVARRAGMRWPGGRGRGRGGFTGTGTGSGPRDW